MSQGNGSTTPSSSSVIQLAVGGIVGIAIGAIIVWVICTNSRPSTSASFPTRRPHIQSKVDEQLADCHLNGAAFAPTRMYQIDLAPQSPPTAPHVDVYNLKPAMSYVALDSTFKPTGPVVNYTQSPNATTPLDLNLDLGAPTTGPTGKPSAVLIRIVNNDPSNTLFGDDYTIISIDEHKDMFCKYQAYTKTEAIIGVRYKAPPPGKTSLYGSFGVGVIVKQQNLPDLPIWIDPEVENNG